MLVGTDFDLQVLTFCCSSQSISGPTQSLDCCHPRACKVLREGSNMLPIHSSNYPLMWGQLVNHVSCHPCHLGFDLPYLERQFRPDAFQRIDIQWWALFLLLKILFPNFCLRLHAAPHLRPAFEPSRGPLGVSTASGWTITMFGPCAIVLSGTLLL